MCSCSPHKQKPSKDKHKTTSFRSIEYILLASDLSSLSHIFRLCYLFTGPLLHIVLVWAKNILSVLAGLEEIFLELKPIIELF